MKINDLNVNIEIMLDGNYAEELKIEINSTNKVCNKYIFLNIQNEDLGAVFFEDYSIIPFPIRNFIDYFKSYRNNLNRREGMNIMSISPPFDYYFLENIFKYTPDFVVNGKKFHVRFNENGKSIRFSYKSEIDKIILDSKDAVLLETNSGPLIFNKSEINPLISPLSGNLLKNLFLNSEIDIDTELKLKLLQKKEQNSALIERFIKLPEVSEFKNTKIIFNFVEAKSAFNLKGFYQADYKNKSYQYPLNFREARKKTLLGEEIIIPFSKERLFIVHSDTDFYQNIRSVVNEVFNNFFEFLNEIVDNNIQTGDNDNLFFKFLPKIQTLVEIRDDKSAVEFINSGFSEKKIEFIEFDPKNSKDSASKIDWLEVNFQFIINDVSLNLAELKDILNKGYIRKDNKIISVNQEEIDFTRELLEESGIKLEDDKWMVRRYKLPLLLKESITPILPEGLKGLPLEIKSDNALQKIALPDRVSNVLRNYQKTGLYWLHFLHRYQFGGILADEMGLGKTVQVLTFLLTIRGEGPSLIVCPSSLLYNWVEEIKKFIGHDLKYQVIEGNKTIRIKKIANVKNYDVNITSYHMAHLDNEEYQKQEFIYCILDEAQHIKNKAAKRTQSIKDIRSKNRIAITGTPLENNIIELWSIFDFLMPDFLGNHQWFKKNFESSINGFDRTERKIALNKLKHTINPFIIRRTKAVVYKELPDKIEQTITMELTENQKKCYLETLSNVRNHYFDVVDKKGMENSYIDFLAALTRLRQICLHPGLVNKDYLIENDDTLSVKLNALIELIQEAIDSGHRMLIFSQFVQMLKIIRKEFHREEIEYLYMDGKTKNRVNLVNEFNRSDIPVFLISLKAGGTGLNLVGADSVVILDPWWNPAVENQAIDRAHRIGQTNVVNVYRLITRGTIEEKINNLQSRKKAVFDSVISKNESFIKNMTWDDIRNLFDWDESKL